MLPTLPENEKKQTLFSRDFILLFCMAMCNNSYMAVFYCFEQWLEGLQVSPNWRGILLSALFAMVLLWRPLASIVLLSRSKLPALLVTICLSSCIMLAYPFIHGPDSIWLILGLRIAQGISLAVYSSCVVAVLVSCIPKGQSARGFAIFSLTTLLPYSIIPAVGEQILPLLGGEPRLFALMAVLAIPALCMLVPLALPVIETGAGNCHVYVDSCLHGEADYEMAVRIIDNAKTQRPSVCNAIEGLIVHQDVAAEILPRVQAAFRTHDVTIYGDEQTRKILGDAVQPVTEELYDTEFNDYKITVKVVASLDEAMAHIAKYSTKHSECIITRDLDAAQKFQRTVDAAVVYVNASTRFTDGGEFGYGAEIGISTQKLHARGPMGLHELTTVKYLVSGNGQIRE